MSPCRALHCVLLSLFLDEEFKFKAVMVWSCSGRQQCGKARQKTFALIQSSYRGEGDEIMNDNALQQSPKKTLSTDLESNQMKRKLGEEENQTSSKFLE